MKTPHGPVLPLQLYLMPGCGTCHQVKEFLNRHHVPVELCWISELRHERRLRELLQGYTGPQSVPFLFAGSDMVQGFQRDAISALLKNAGHELCAAEAPNRRDSEQRITIPREALWVASFLEGSLVFVDPISGLRLLPSLHLGPETHPMSVAYDPLSGVAAVSRYGDHALTFFDLVRGTYLHGSSENSTLQTAQGPTDFAFDPCRQRFYVPATQSGLVMAIDSRTGRFANGGLAESSVCLGHPLTGGIVIDTNLDRIYLSTAGWLCAVDLETWTPIGDGVEVGNHRGLAVDPDTHRVYVAGSELHAVLYVDGFAMRYAFGTLERSSVATDPTPFAIAVDSISSKLFVSCMSTQRIQVLEAGSPQRSALPALDAGAATRTFAMIEDGVLATSSFDDGEVSFIDTRGGRYLNQSRARSSIEVGEGARGIAWIGGAARRRPIRPLSQMLAPARRGRSG